MTNVAKKIKYDFYCEEIISGKTKKSVLYDSDTVIAFHHTRPFYKIHIVVVPKEHILDLTAVTEKHRNLLWEIITVSKNIIKNLSQNNKGIRLLTNFGEYQDSPHLHFHIVSGDKIK
ncbi:MAG: hypothetical protein A2604_00825 [Candidatus Liptonbacteria bacterium RIFOXYD1_FULL_36_11]|uniref:HIT domain-containing protein n=1 Tax=Candidatus Liptonbacteria bacterium RIFOXYD1_FULL_36_11 TaxID=1798656 RepID=A0A1G2CSE4_9BACT|nr:MAG: hypothetical protein A2604_00825 [Candidatus Liptonbacteria bacterium RIFOXYD1_FULL_36_11]